MNQQNLFTFKEIAMKIDGRLGVMLVILVGVVGLRAGVPLLAHEKDSAQKARVAIERLPDGSWKFARVIGFTEKLESAAPISDPCE
jgi:hypothetical protein